MKIRLLSTLLLATSVSAFAAQDTKTVCTHGDKTRVIEVVYTTDDVVPCEVRYTKSEGTSTPWKAANKAGYCEEKAAAFIAKQEGWGWACEAANEAMPASTEDNPAEVGSNEAMTEEGSVATVEQ